MNTANVITVDPEAPSGEHASMEPYSEDLRMRIAKAVEEGASKSAAARLFDMCFSSVKRCVRSASRGESLVLGKGGGRPPKADRTTQKLLEEDANKRPAAAVSERRRFLEQRKAEARTREALVEAMGAAISALTARDARGFFEHRGYATPVQSL